MKKICIALCLLCSMLNPMQVYATGQFPETPTETTSSGQFPEADVEKWENREEEKIVEWYQIEEGGTMFRSGGINKIDGEKVETEEEMQALEAELQSSGYVQVTGEGRDISAEDYALLEQNRVGLPFANWIDPDSKHTAYYDDFYRVYIYKPIYNDLIEQLKEDGRVSSITGREASASMVVINDGEWYHKNRIGKIITEYNNQLPEWADAGFLQIESQIDACVTMMYTSGQYYVQFFVKANEPFLVKLRTGGYYITSINTEGIAVEEGALMHHNSIYISESHTESDPKILSIKQVVEKYNIAPLENIEEQPDYSWGNRWEYAPIEDIPEEDVIVEEQEQQKESKSLSKRTWTFVLLGMFSIIIIAVIMAYKIVKKKYSQF